MRHSTILFVGAALISSLGCSTGVLSDGSDESSDGGDSASSNCANAPCDGDKSGDKSGDGAGDNAGDEACIDCGDTDQEPTCTGTECDVVIFEETFDALGEQDLVGRCNHEQDLSDSSGDGTPDCEQVPDRWDFVYCSDSNPTNPGGGVRTAAARGSSGKGLRFWDESNGDANSWGSECQLMKHFAPNQYPEMWYEYYIRWNASATSPGTNAKVTHFGHYWEDVIDGTTDTTIVNSNNDRLSPANTTAGFIISNYREVSGNYEFRTSVRCNPAYKCDFSGGAAQGSPDGSGTGGHTERYQLRENAPACTERVDKRWGATLGDGQWHRVEHRLVINSAAGAADGIYELWFDNCRIGRRMDVPWRGTGVNPDHGGFNMISIGGNQNNVWAGQTNEEQHTYDIDNIRVCSSRCP